ncbi:MAG: CheR family methyltransferase [Pseudomonadota bacterium]
MRVVLVTRFPSIAFGTRYEDMFCCDRNTTPLKLREQFSAYGVERDYCPELDSLKTLVQQRFGLVIGDSRGNDFIRAVSSRMAQLECSSVCEYRRYVSEKPSEPETLASQFTVNETYFFRDHGHLELLLETVEKESGAPSGWNEPLRVLSAGCSTGEEVYSVIIAFVERYGIEHLDKVQVHGIDVDRTALAKANSGIYSDYSFRGRVCTVQSRYGGPLRDRYFRSEGGRFYLDEAIRERAEFTQFNLFHSDYPELEKFDAILYNNVSIYFEPATQESIFRRLVQLVRPGGIVITSPVEVPRHMQYAKSIGGIALRDYEGTYYFQCGESTPSHHTPAGGEQSCQPRTAVKKKKALTPPRHHRLSAKTEAPKAEAVGRPALAQASRTEQGADDLHQLRREVETLMGEERFEQALEVIESAGTLSKTDTDLLMLRANLLYQLERLDEARADSLTVLERSPSRFEALFLLGQIAYRHAEWAEAASWLRHAAYAEPACWMSHYYLASALAELGKKRQARMTYQAAIHAVRRHGVNNSGLSQFVFAGGAEEIEVVCHRRIQALDSQSVQAG